MHDIRKSETNLQFTHKFAQTAMSKTYHNHSFFVIARFVIGFAQASRLFTSDSEGRCDAAAVGALLR